MLRVQVVEGGIGSSDGSTHRQSTIPMSLFHTPYRQAPLYATTSPNVGDQHDPSPTTTLEDVREENSIKCEGCYHGVVCVVSKGSFPITFMENKDCVPIKLPNIAGII